MIDVKYGERFLKDLKVLKSTPVFDKIHQLCFEELPNYQDTREIKNLKKIQGYEEFYRIKLGDYRVGLRIENNTLFLMRVLHRKEIYHYFPKK